VRTILVRLPSWVTGVAWSAFAAIYAVPFVLMTRQDGDPDYVVPVAGVIVAGVFTASAESKSRLRLTQPGEDPLTADERVRAVKACIAGQPPHDQRIRGAAAKIAREWLRLRRLKTREIIFFSALAVILGALSLTGAHRVSLLYLPLGGAILGYVSFRNRRRRRQAQAYLTGIEAPPVA
jgi:hypothetical protein